MIASLRLPSATPAIGSTQAPSSSGPRCARAFVMPMTCRRIASGPRLLAGSRNPAMPHTESLPVLIVDDPPFHPHAGQRHPHEIRTSAAEGTLVESSADFRLVVAGRHHR